MRDQAVGVFRRIEPAVFVGHVAADVIENVARGFLEERIARDLECGEIRNGQLRLVVEHFLEMRDVPELVCGISMKSATDVIVNPALGHFAQGEDRHLQRALALS